MVAKFWDALGSKLADRWLATGVPALVFWGLGIAAWATATGRVDEVRAWIDDLAAASLGTQLLVVAGGVVLVSVSALIVDRLTLPATRILEGYWPAWATPLRQALVAARGRAIRRHEARWQNLAAKVHDGTATPDEQREFAEIEVRQMRIPAMPRRMPTRLGDILRAAETRPIDKYGLDAVKVWSRFWLVLPETTRSQLAIARGGMDDAVAACIWAVLGIILAIWWPVALFTAPIVARVIYVSWVCSRAEVFADLVEAAFDLHRPALYAGLRWPLPASPKDERRAGEALTDYLWRGSEAPEPTFTAPRG